MADNTADLDKLSLDDKDPTARDIDERISELDDEVDSLSVRLDAHQQSIQALEADPGGPEVGLWLAVIAVWASAAAVLITAIVNLGTLPAEDRAAFVLFMTAGLSVAAVITTVKLAKLGNW
jgi:hypothetical protein